MASEKIAVVGSREGARLEDVAAFMQSLHEKYPDSIIVSGGAVGVDQMAETTWLGLGGRVISYRPAPGTFVTDGDGKTRVTEWYIEVWKLGTSDDWEQMVYPLVGFPTFENFKSAAIARDTLINEEADRLISFQAPGGTRGSSFTMEWREDVDGKPRYRYE